MPGKCRPSLRRKTLTNVDLSDLSHTDKHCIRDVFRLTDTQQTEIERLREFNEQLENDILNERMNYEHSQAEVDRLKATFDNKLTTFLEKLKEVSFVGNSADGIAYMVRTSDVKELVKELTAVIQ